MVPRMTGEKTRAERSWVIAACRPMPLLVASAARAAVSRRPVLPPASSVNDPQGQSAAAL
jgi:hypothetical protein